jgi:hypothetical protein
MEPTKYCKYNTSEDQIHELSFQLNLQHHRRQSRRMITSHSMTESSEMNLENDDTPNLSDQSETSTLKRKRPNQHTKRPLVIKDKKDGLTKDGIEVNSGESNVFNSNDILNLSMEIKKTSEETDATKQGQNKSKRSKKDTGPERKRSRKEKEHTIPLTFEQIPWLPLEDDVILRGVKTFGENWSLITELVNSLSFTFRDRRTRAQCFNRFHSHLKVNFTAGSVLATDFEKSTEKSSKKLRPLLKPPKTSVSILEIMKRRAKDLLRPKQETTPNPEWCIPFSPSNNSGVSDVMSPSAVSTVLKQRQKQGEQTGRQKGEEAGTQSSLYHATEEIKKPSLLIPKKITLSSESSIRPLRTNENLVSTNGPLNVSVMNPNGPSSVVVNPNGVASVGSSSGMEYPTPTFTSILSNPTTAVPSLSADLSFSSSFSAKTLHTKSQVKGETSTPARSRARNGKNLIANRPPKEILRGGNSDSTSIPTTATPSSMVAFHLTTPSESTHGDPKSYSLNASEFSTSTRTTNQSPMSSYSINEHYPVLPPTLPSTTMYSDHSNNTSSNRKS